jgi:voltage-gated potassium channel
MADSTDAQADASPEARPPLGTIVWGLVRALGSTVLLVVVYYLLPLDHVSIGAGITMLIAGLVVFLGLVTFQVRSIIASPFPGLRAVEALSTSVPFFLLLFASTYLVMATIAASNFSQPMTHTNALYFTVTVFATVGFGDITAKTEAARLVVTGQMITDLIIIGLGARIILGAVTRSRQLQPASPMPPRRRTARWRRASAPPPRPRRRRRP